MRKQWILCCFLLLSLIPLSCSQKEREWRDIAKFANHEVEFLEGYRVISGDSAQTDPFSVTGGRLRIFCASGCASSLTDVEPSPSAGFLTVDLYHYPDMRFVRRAVNETWTGDVSVEPSKDFFFVRVGQGMYCFYVTSSASVSWGLTVSECV